MIGTSPLDILLHGPPHHDQSAPNLLKERNHFVDLGIARQLKLRLARLRACGTLYTGYGQPAGQKLLLQRRVLALQVGDLGLQRRALVGYHFAGPAGIAPAALRALAGAGVEAQHAVDHS